MIRRAALIAALCVAGAAGAQDAPVRPVAPAQVLAPAPQAAEATTPTEPLGAPQDPRPTDPATAAKVPAPSETAQATEAQPSAPAQVAEATLTAPAQATEATPSAPMPASRPGVPDPARTTPNAPRAEAAPASDLGATPSPTAPQPAPTRADAEATAPDVTTPARPLPYATPPGRPSAAPALRPQGRPGANAAPAPPPVQRAVPVSRPSLAAPSPYAVRQAERPHARPARVQARAQARLRAEAEARAQAKSAYKSTRPAQSAPSGSGLCGVPGLSGRAISTIHGRGRCGIPAPVQVTHVHGIRLSSPARIDCQTARTFANWVSQGAKPAVGNRGGGIAEFHVMASYSCRTRNSRPGAKLSEHALGHAIDIGGVKLRDGSRITVLNDWGGGAKGRILRQFHSSACGRFGTVLGPNSDRHHKNHFHFDTARYRAGSYCR